MSGGLVYGFDPGKDGAGVCIDLDTGALRWLLCWQASVTSKKRAGYPVWFSSAPTEANELHEGRCVETKQRCMEQVLHTLVHTDDCDEDQPPNVVIEGLFIAPGPGVKGKQDSEGNTRLPLYESPGALQATITLALGMDAPVAAWRPLANVWRRELGIRTHPADAAELEAVARARPALEAFGFFKDAHVRHHGPRLHVNSIGAVSEALCMARWLRARLLAGRS